MQPDLGQDAGSAGGRGAKEVGNDPLGQIVALDLFPLNHRRHQGRHSEVSGDIAGDQSGHGEQIGSATAGTVTQPGGMDQRQPSRRGGDIESIPDGLQNGGGLAHTSARTLDPNLASILDQGGGLLAGEDFIFDGAGRHWAAWR